VCQAEVSLLIEGADDGFVLEGASHARDQPRSAGSGASDGRRHHQYPDGFMLFLGTMFSPVKDRGAQGGGFTHHLGDRVTIASAALGALVNEVQRSDAIPPWTLACAPCTRTWRSAA
jgi:fumarylacetoacetate (FAA) hydrolase family protein